MGLVGWDSEAEFLKVAASHAPIMYRWFGKTLAVDDLGAIVGTDSKWRRIRTQLQPGDRIWPFTINPNTMALREGFVVIRDGQPIEALLTRWS